MSDWIASAGLITLFVLVFGILAFVQYKKQQEIRKEYPGYPKGHWIKQGIGIGIAIGAGIGVPLNNIPLGFAIGISIGASLGIQREKKHKDEIRPLVDEEKKLRVQTIIFMAMILLTGIMISLLPSFLKT